MKVIVLILFATLTNQIFSQSIGDNLQDYLEANSTSFANNTIFQPLSSWKDSVTTILYRSDNVEEADRLIYLNFSMVPYAIEVRNAGNEYFLFDIDGNGSIDFKSDQFFFPYWCISPFIKSSKDSQAYYLLDLLFGIYQSDSGPSQMTSKSTELANIFEEIGEDIDQPDRDIVYALFYYLQNSTINPKIAISNIVFMQQRYYDRYNKNHPIFYLFFAEMMIRLGETERAIEWTNYLRIVSPDFIPGMILEYRLEKNTSKKQEMIDSLFDLYPNHWLVKSYYNQ